MFIDLLPAGRVLKRGCKVPFPQPTAVAEIEPHAPIRRELFDRLEATPHEIVGRRDDPRSRGPTRTDPPAGLRREPRTSGIQRCNKNVTIVLAGENETEPRVAFLR